ncbi:hypothetical protein [Sphingobacterium sp. IITKGP-BTPF85]|uniref:hypothetical protein n=1 Tax=Sphingobacterium sp. IITKGP-BTPF85 TaxID=1338009 RepID=UPI00038A4CA4|nr:hypothetical protein [Sphingobacterium sp. IITKGP-BTPF85]KKX49203.1 hypothetical protein L950_0217070 [Sphingobacterium sp. IITKGP-BTPF85]
MLYKAIEKFEKQDVAGNKERKIEDRGENFKPFTANHQLITDCFFIKLPLMNLSWE